MKNGILYFHQGWTDIINCLPLATFYSKTYDKVYVLMRKDAKDLVDFYVRGTNIQPVYIDKLDLDGNDWWFYELALLLSFRNWSRRTHGRFTLFNFIFR